MACAWWDVCVEQKTNMYVPCVGPQLFYVVAKQKGLLASFVGGGVRTNAVQLFKYVQRSSVAGGE